MNDDDFKPLTKAIRSVSDAITAPVCGGPDETGGHVASLTEAVMGMTAGLIRIAEAIDGLASAVGDTETHDRTVARAIDGLAKAVGERLPFQPD